MRNGGVAIAYQVVGDGEHDLVYVPDWTSNLVYWLGVSALAGRSTSASPVVPPDPVRQARDGSLRPRRHISPLWKRGWRTCGRCSMRSARRTRSSSGRTRGSGMAALFAATYPERTRALVLFHPVAHGLRGSKIHRGTARTENCAKGGATRRGATSCFRDGVADACMRTRTIGVVRRLGYESVRARRSPTRSTAPSYETDLREVLPAVSVPTLVLYRRETHMPAEKERWTSRRGSRARAMRVSGSDYFGIFLSLDIADEIDRFVADEEAPTRPGERLDDTHVHRSRRLDRARHEDR